MERRCLCNPHVLLACLSTVGGIFSEKDRIQQKAIYKIVFKLRHGWEPSAGTAHRLFILSKAVKGCAEHNVLSCCGVRVFLNYSSFWREESITCLQGF